MIRIDLSYSQLIILLLSLLISTTLGAQVYEGRVYDLEQRHPLYRVEIKSTAGQLLALTDTNGYYKFGYEQDSIRVVYSKSGYLPHEQLLRPQTYAHIDLESVVSELSGVTVEEYRTQRGNSSYTYTLTDLKKYSTLIGESDVLRYIQILPGVSQGMEGGMGLYVRGAGNGHNRTELDGVPLQAPTHLFGLFSFFHPDIVGKSTFQMGGITAASGDLLSSLLSIETTKPSSSRYRGMLSISPILASGAVEGYIVKDKLSYQVAARSSLLRPEYWLVRKVVATQDKERAASMPDVNPQIQDVYGKVHWRITPKHSAELLYLWTQDHLGYIFPKSGYNSSLDETQISTTDIHMGWHNQVAQARWIYTPSPRTQWQTAAYYTSFRSYISLDTHRSFGSTQRSTTVDARRHEMALKSKLTTQYGASGELSAGASFRYVVHTPITNESRLPQNYVRSGGQVYKSMLTSAFAESSNKFGAARLRAGLRYNLYIDHTKQANHGIDAHIRATVDLTPSLGLEASLDRLSQYSHTIEGAPLGWSMDLVVPSSKQLPPEQSNQIYLGGYWGNTDYYTSIGGYYRTLSHLIAYRSTLNHFFAQNTSWEETVTSGSGRSIGLEVWGEKRKGRLTGSLAYTLSYTTRTYKELNDGRPFPYELDRRHNLNLQAQYVTVVGDKHEQRANIGCYLTSGNNTTLPMSTYKAENLPYWQTVGRHDNVNLQQYYHSIIRTKMSPRNSYRLPPYFRVDVGYSFLWKGRRVNHELTASVYNVLNRQNPFLYVKQDDTWKQISLLPILPSIRWEMRF